MRFPYLLSLSTASLLAIASVPAQQFQAPGTMLGAGLDVIVTQGVSFMFPMPDGTMANSLDINTSGRIFAGGTGNINFTPTLAAVLTEAASINVAYDDALDSAIFYNEPMPGLAVITWMMGDKLDFASLGSLGNPEFIMQAQLSASGDIVMLYDSQIQLTDALVGVTPGMAEVGAPLPVDLSTSTGIAIVPPTATVVEEFIGGAGLDLQSTALTYTAVGGGNYIVTGTNPIPNPAQAVPGRSACGATLQALTFFPTVPGYLVVEAGAFDANFNVTGTALGSGDDSILPVALSFPFAMPGQLVGSNNVEIDSNGRVLQAGVGEGSDFSPSTAEFAMDAVAQIAPLWSDWSPNPGADVWVNDTGASASITWDGVPEFASGGATTFQIQLNADNSFVVIFEDVSEINDLLNIFIVGTSPGNVADPGEIDLSSTIGSATGTDIAYEMFDPVALDLVDFGIGLNDNLTLVASRPAIGTNLEADVIDANGLATGAVYFFGFPTGLFVPTINLGILSPLLSDCELLTDIVTPGATVAQAAGSVGTPTVLIAIPNLPAVVGIEGLVISALALTPGGAPLLTPTDELVITIGN